MPLVPGYTGPLYDAEMAEHSAWLFIGSELKRLGIDLNKEDRLNAGLVAWGEELVQLRSLQSDEVREKELAEARALFEKEVENANV